MPKINYRFCYVFIIFFLGLFNNSFATQQDNKAKMIILSDSTIYDNKSGITIFEGHVKVTQGTTLILADRLTTKTNTAHKISEIIAYGTTKVAEYSQMADNGQLFKASANVIKYYPTDANITLEQNVTVTQGKNSFHASVIHYNRLSETLIVPESSTGRAVLIYNPDSKSGL